MQIRSRIVSLNDCKRIAERMDVELYNSGSYDMEVIQRSGIKLLKFTLRPVSGTNTYRSYDPINDRRIWAVDWQGHYVFMRAIFALDPAAKIKTAYANYDGLEVFLDLAPDTALKNVGSMIYPLYASEKSMENSYVTTTGLENRANDIAAELITPERFPELV